MDHPPVEDGFDAVDQQVLHDPVAELRGEDLAPHRTPDDEAARTAGTVGPRAQLAPQRHEVVFETYLEGERLRPLRLWRRQSVYACIKSSNVIISSHPFK